MELTVAFSSDGSVISPGLCYILSHCRHCQIPRSDHISLVKFRYGGRSHPKVFCKKEALKSFAKSKGKHLYWTLFLKKVGGLRPEACSFMKN